MAFSFPRAISSPWRRLTLHVVPAQWPWERGCPLLARGLPPPFPRCILSPHGFQVSLMLFHFVLTISTKCPPLPHDLAPQPLPSSAAFSWAQGGLAGLLCFSKA